MAAKHIPWKYCDCGCKSSYATIGGAYFGHYDDLRGGHWFGTRHHPTVTGEKVASIAEINRRIRQALKIQKKLVIQQLSELEDV